ncbi:PaaI family thioesterase [uncultured Phascolarctobacterium sp.]|uniref:PaaI family thioesterase n=1 Tax=uncultured Phascolarctobacterium sp. TaxID=512296 RepID=UPI0025FB5181|nr:PaaI family thioesterase [uncultured Phascolarctobacterium sp.]
MESEKIIRKMWSSNAFMNVLKIQIKEVHCGGATLEMPIDFDIHTNHWLGVHGGAMAALADCVAGITCASVGKICTTLNMNIDYISNMRGLGALTVSSEILHKGQSTINIAAKITDDAGNIICSVTYIMFVMDKLGEVPEKW